MDPIRSLSEPTGTSALSDAATWVQQAMLGSAATAMAVIAVGCVGLLMLGGRLDLRRGAGVVLGCFILFGSPAIASALRALADQLSDPVRIDFATPPETNAGTPPPTLPPSAPYDPYSGASVPTR